MDTTLSTDKLKCLQRTELKIIDEFDRICRENSISYFLDSGSALGAIRHNGFIPWDDDVDIGMMREDYERFIDVAKSCLAPGFTLQTHETEPQYYKFNAKIRLDNTIYPEKSSEKFKHRGIAIDIYPFDYVADNVAVAQKEINKSRFYYRLCTLRRLELKEVRKLTWKVLRLILGIRPEKWYRDQFEKICGMHSAVKTNHVTCFSYRMARNMYLIFNYSDMYPVVPTRFEDREYWIMNDPDTYLRTMYGDYMQLPPEEKRVCHLNGEIVYDLGANETVNNLL